VLYVVILLLLEPPPAGALAPTPEATEAATTATRSAMSEYVHGFNDIVRVGPQIQRSYESELPEGSKTDVRRVHLFPPLPYENDLRTARGEFSAAWRAAPDALPELAKPSRALVARAQALLDAYQAAWRYYDAQDWKDDGGRGGKQLDARMRAASREFASALGGFEVILSRLEDADMRTELKQFEAPSYGHWFRQYNLDAKRLVRALHSGDLAQKLSLLDALEQSHTVLAAFCKAKGDGLHPLFRVYLAQADSFAAAAKRWGRALRAHEAVAEEGARLVDAYNDMIGLSNDLRRYELQGFL
jgi:hypothetical protein